MRRIRLNIRPTWARPGTEPESQRLAAQRPTTELGPRPQFRESGPATVAGLVRVFKIYENP